MARMIRFKDLLPFGRPKTPGFGISKGFYLSVLANTAALPPLLAILSPQGAAGSVKGFGVPLRKDSEKGDVAKPLMRGFYGLASPDQKTVLKLAVVSRDEAGFDPAPVLMSPMGLALSDEVRARIAATWNLLQVTYESHDPAVYPALDFILAICRRMAELTDGIIADPVCQVYRLPSDVPSPFDEGMPFAVRDHIHVHARPQGNAGQLYTLGLSKFAMPELELLDVRPEAEIHGTALLYTAAQMALAGTKLKAGVRLGGFQLEEGGQDKALWDGIPCLALVPSSPGGTSATLLELDPS